MKDVFGKIPFERRKMQKERRHCTKEWGAISAIEEDDTGYYLVRHPDKVLTLWCDETLEEE